MARVQPGTRPQAKTSRPAPAPAKVIDKALETPPGPKRARVLATLEKQLPANRRAVQQALDGLGDRQRARLIKNAGPKLLALLQPGAVRAMDDAHFKAKVRERGG